MVRKLTKNSRLYVTLGRSIRQAPVFQSFPETLNNHQFGQHSTNNNFSIQINMNTAQNIVGRLQKLETDFRVETDRLSNQVDRIAAQVQTHESQLKQLADAFRNNNISPGNYIDNSSGGENIQAPPVEDSDAKAPVVASQVTSSPTMLTAYPNLSFSENPFLILGPRISNNPYFSIYQYGNYKIEISGLESPDHCNHVVIDHPNGKMSFRQPVNLYNITMPLYKWLTITKEDVTIWEPELKGKMYEVLIYDFMEYTSKNERQKKQIKKFLERCQQENRFIKKIFNDITGTLIVSCYGQ